MKRDWMIWLILGAIAIAMILLLASGDSGMVLGIEDEIFARTFYLGLLSVVIAGGVIGSGIGFGRGVRIAAVWAAIIAVLMAGYQYRYELQDIASRVTAGLVPGSPLSVRDDDGRVSVMLERLSNGHFEVHAQINEVPVTVMIDTGATSTVLSAEDALRAGFDPTTLAYTIRTMTANGEARAARVVADEIRVGDTSAVACRF
jgi:aspartyl protease family protein